MFQNFTKTAKMFCTENKTYKSNAYVNKNDIDLKINIIAKPRKFVLFLFALVVTINSLEIRSSH